MKTLVLLAAGLASAATVTWASWTTPPSELEKSQPAAPAITGEIALPAPPPPNPIITCPKVPKHLQHPAKEGLKCMIPTPVQIAAEQAAEPEPPYRWICEEHPEEHIEMDANGDHAVEACAESMLSDTIQLREFQVVDYEDLIHEDNIIRCWMGCRHQKCGHTMPVQRKVAVLHAIDEEPLEPLEVKVFPNPTRERTTFRLNETPDGPYAIRLFDFTGKLCRNYPNVTGNNFTVTRDNLPGGVYLYQVEVQDTDQTLTGRLVVQ